MPRNISFSMTEPQFLDGSKDVTRRMGWLRLQPGDLLNACRKCMGLKPGEKIVRLGTVIVLSARRERLDAITPDDVRREGFPNMTPAEFVAFFCKGHAGCKPDSIVTRIEFRRVGHE
jgi:hypothetical protein